MFRTGRLEPVLINSALVSAQNRERLYWCNWKVTQPKDKHILLKDVIENASTERNKSYCIDANYAKGTPVHHYFEKGLRQLVIDTNNGKYRKLTVTECERLQTLTDGYCRAVSNSRAYHGIGNGWTVDVIAHIFKQLFSQKNINNS